MKHKHKSGPRGQWRGNVSTVALRPDDVPNGLDEFLPREVTVPVVDPLEGLTVAQLRAYAKEHDVKLRFARTRTEILEVLRAA